MKLDKRIMKYFDRRRTGKWTGEVSTYDFTVRLLGFTSFAILMLALIAGIIYFLLVY